MIKLIAFDLWGTLAIRGNPFYHFSESLVQEFDIKISKREISKILEEVVQLKYWETEHDAYTEVAKRLKISPTKDNILKLMSLKVKEEEDVILFNFVIPLFKKLKEKKYKIAIISNSSMFVYNYFKRKTDILKYVDFEHFSFQTGYLKPNPQMYLELQRKAKVFNNEMLIVGDDFENDFKAPKQLGINAILFRDYEDLLEKFKEYKIFI